MNQLIENLRQIIEECETLQDCINRAENCLNLIEDYTIIEDYPESVTAYKFDPRTKHIHIFTDFKSEFIPPRINQIHIPTFKKILVDMEYRLEVQDREDQEEYKYEMESVVEYAGSKTHEYA